MPRRSTRQSSTFWPWGMRSSPAPSPPSWSTQRKVPPPWQLQPSAPCGNSVPGTSPARYPTYKLLFPLGSLPPFAYQHTDIIPQTALSRQVKRAMRRIFHEKRKSYEKTCRLAAAEILLDNTPLSMDVINILLAAHHLGTEAATFLLLKVQSSLHANHHPARWVLLFVLPNTSAVAFELQTQAYVFSSPWRLTLWLVVQHTLCNHINLPICTEQASTNSFQS